MTTRREKIQNIAKEAVEEVTSLEKQNRREKLRDEIYKNMTVSIITKYTRPCPFNDIDVYRVLEIFEVTDPALQHAVKKLLCAGKRGGKDKATDIRETIIALERWEEMRKQEKDLLCNCSEATHESGCPAKIK